MSTTGSQSGVGRDAASYMSFARRVLSVARDEADALNEGAEPERGVDGFLWERARGEVERVSRWHATGMLGPELAGEWRRLVDEIRDSGPAIRRLGLPDLAPPP